MYSKDMMEIIGVALEDLHDWETFEEDMATNPWGN